MELFLFTLLHLFAVTLMSRVNQQEDREKIKSNRSLSYTDDHSSSDQRGKFPSLSIQDPAGPAVTTGTAIAIMGFLRGWGVRKQRKDMQSKTNVKLLA